MLRFEKLNGYINACMAEGFFPGAVILVGDEESDLFFESYGDAQVVPEKRVMVPDAIFDIASLTKPIATAVALLILKEQKKLMLDDKLMKYFEEFKQSAYADVTIFDLLVHTSGIPAWYPLYIVSKNFTEQIRFIADCQPVFKRNQGVEYSCLNYILLGEIIRKVSGFSVAEFCRTNIFELLGMVDTSFVPAEEEADRFVTTEIGNQYEKDVCKNYETKVEVKWRDYPISGEVHDGNSHYGFGGVSGNAGLFSTAHDMSIFIRSLLKGKSVISRDTIDEMINDYTSQVGQGRGIGWGIGSKFAGQLFSGKTFGHTGFTGVSLYVDPDARLFVVFLTNAVHPVVKKGILDEVRPRVCDLAFEEARQSK